MLDLWQSERAVAPVNASFQSFTESTFHESRSWLNCVALLNIFVILTTDPVCHELRGWSNAAAK